MLLFQIVIFVMEMISLNKIILYGVKALIRRDVLMFSLQNRWMKTFEENIWHCMTEV